LKNPATTTNDTGSRFLGLGHFCIGDELVQFGKPYFDKKPWRRRGLNQPHNTYQLKEQHPNYVFVFVGMYQTRAEMMPDGSFFPTLGRPKKIDLKKKKKGKIAVSYTTLVKSLKKRIT